MSELAILGGTATRTRPFEPWPQYTGSDARRLLEVLESRNWGGYPFPNQFANDFAQKFADYHGAKYGCCVANGTIALVVALQAAGIRFGDEVIVPAYTWDGTAAAVLFAGAVPVFADIDRTLIASMSSPCAVPSHHARERSSPCTWRCVSRIWMRSSHWRKSTTSSWSKIALTSTAANIKDAARDRWVIWAASVFNPARS